MDSEDTARIYTLPGQPADPYAAGELPIEDWGAPIEPPPPAATEPPPRPSGRPPASPIPRWAIFAVGVAVGYAVGRV